jgi:methyl-accepting chemotaxis protein
MLKRANVRAADMYEGLSGKNAMRPEIFIVFDRSGNPIFVPPSSPVNDEDLANLEAVTKVRQGTSYFNKLMLHDNQAYVVAGVPIHRFAQNQTEVVGGIVVGVALARYFGEYKRDSDDVEKDQLRLTLVRGDDVVSSAFTEDKYDQLVEALHPDKLLRVKDGPDTISVIDFDGQTWDFYSEQVAGYVGPDVSSNLGSIYLMKTRAGLREPQGYLFGALTGIGLAIVIATLLAAWITRPINTFIHATAEISQGAGDLTRRIDVKSNDELGDLAHNLNRVFDNLQVLASDVQNASFQVGASSAQISAASKQMLEGAKEQAVKIEGSTAAATELSTSIQQVAQNATEATKFARQSNEQMAQAIESINHIRHTVDEAAEKIRDLGESGKRIGNIVEVIRQISEQTSLLALNASIEAAHAGEQGRGFAVVADEVSSLAKRVGQSAKDIEDLIATIKDQTAEAVTTMQNGTREVEGGTQLVTGTLGDLKRILDVIQDTARAVQEQAVVSDEIARNMDVVQKIANEVLASSEEAVIQGEQLHGLAHHLEESVRGFNLDSGKPQLASAEAPAKPAPPARTLPPRDKKRA